MTEKSEACQQSRNPRGAGFAPAAERGNDLGGELSSFPSRPWLPGEAAAGAGSQKPGAKPRLH